jgi:pyruvate formate lyase activating enzyme
MADRSVGDSGQNLLALVTNIQGYSVHDGPGIRTTVFLKGCPLACRWCANPECISPRAELGFLEALCVRCGECLSSCPNGAISGDATGLPVIDRSCCTGCGECVTACTRKARVIHGKAMTVDEVLDAVVADTLFYDSSGGGVTVSGGEPLMHARFVRCLFEKLHAQNIQTCLETSGHADVSTFLEVLQVTDYVLFDLKLMNARDHRRFTGRSNASVLANARLLATSKREFLCRMPLIPGISDTPENIRETAHFLEGLGERAQRIELMPYHRLGESKYASLGKRYHLHGLMPIEPEEVERARIEFERNGIECSVSA